MANPVYPSESAEHPIVTLAATLRQKGLSARSIAALALIQVLASDSSWPSERRRLPVESLAAALGQSPQTLRHDLRELEALDLVWVFDLGDGHGRQVEGRPWEPVLEYGGALSPLKRAQGRC